MRWRANWPVTQVRCDHVLQRSASRSPRTSACPAARDWSAFGLPLRPWPAPRRHDTRRRDAQLPRHHTQAAEINSPLRRSPQMFHSTQRLQTPHKTVGERVGWRNHAPNLHHSLTPASFAIVASDQPPLTGGTSEAPWVTTHASSACRLAAALFAHTRGSAVPRPVRPYTGEAPHLWNGTEVPQDRPQRRLRESLLHLSGWPKVEKCLRQSMASPYSASIRPTQRWITGVMDPASDAERTVHRARAPTRRGYTRFRGP